MNCPVIGVAMPSPLDAELIKSCILRQLTFAEVFTTGNLDSLLSKCDTHPIVAAIIDVRFDGRSAIDVGHRLLADCRVSHVLFLDRFFCRTRKRLAETTGATYCSRSISLRTLVYVISKLVRKEELTCEDYAMLRDSEKQHRIDTGHGLMVTKRELAVWTLIAEGHSVAGCAEMLGIAVSTADNHKSRLMKKLKVNKSVELVRMAVRLGLVEP